MQIWMFAPAVLSEIPVNLICCTGRGEGTGHSGWQAEARPWPRALFVPAAVLLERLGRACLSPIVLCATKDTDYRLFLGNR